MAVRFKHILEIPCGIRYSYSTLTLNSPLTDNLLLESKMEYKSEKIETLYSDLKEFKELLHHDGALTPLKEQISLELSHLKDIRNSISRLADGYNADDIELFEIKSLILINQKIREIIEGVTINSIQLPNLEEPLSLLDPDGYKVPSFYIYDSYDDELKELRARLKKEKGYNEELHYQAALIEERVRVKLSSSIRGVISSLVEAIENLAKLDLLIAKALQLYKYGLTIPTTSQSKIEYSSLFNPEVVEILSKEKREYQKIDISLKREKPLLITGSNMGGKSLTLKSLALAQYLYQFGFAIPATSATITPVDQIELSSGDDEDYRRGLSSFAAEMKRIDGIVGRINRGERILALIDEPARTTNPLEGRALASSLLKLLYNRGSFIVMTTHYTIENRECDRLRVKGFIEGKMDYSLIVDNFNETPREALNIAKSLGIDSQWLELATRELDEN